MKVSKGINMKTRLMNMIKIKNEATNEVVVLDKVKKVVMVELSQQIYQHQQVTQLSKVTYLVQVAVSARTSCMLFRLARMRKVLLS